MERSRDPRLAFRRPRNTIALLFRTGHRLRRPPKGLPLPRRRLPIVERRLGGGLYAEPPLAF